MNKPVAWISRLPEGDVYNCAWAKKQNDDDIPLYTHPVKELNDGGEPVKNATYWKRQYNLMATQNDNLKSGLYHANEQIKYLESNPVKELTDEEIADFLWAYCLDMGDVYEASEAKLIECVKAILRKAQEK